MKICSLCKTRKERSEFPWQDKSKNKVMSACKHCHNARSKSRRLLNPEKQKELDRAAYQKHKKHRVEYARMYRELYPDRTRATNLKTKYGITIEDYNAMLKSQKCRCLICGEHQDDLKKILCVDHCHKTNRVRGLLCDNCNKFLGFYEKLGSKCREYLL